MTGTDRNSLYNNVGLWFELTCMNYFAKEFKDYFFDDRSPIAYFKHDIYV